MTSVIMPTMWKSPLTWRAIRSIVEQPSVGELILIDTLQEKQNGNRPFARAFGKGLVYIEDNNTNPNHMWNKGVQLAKFDKLIFVKDNIHTDWTFINLIEEYITEYRGMIGAGITCWKEIYKDAGIESIEKITPYYDYAFGIHKNSYVNLPEDNLIHYGGDWLFTKCDKPNYQITHWKMEMDVVKEELTH
jgi:hypothetical protein